MESGMTANRHSGVSVSVVLDHRQNSYSEDNVSGIREFCATFFE
jgi:hypothetical protein